MAKQVLLVSEQRLKQWTNLDDNVRLNEITPNILQAQDIYIQNLIGTKLYDRLKAGVIAGDLTANEDLLLNDYVGKTLMQYALYMILPSIKYKVANQGILNGTSEETQPTSLDELQYLRETTLDTAMFYDKRLREYLIQNPAQFQEWLTWENNGMPRNSDTPYFSGLQTEKSFNINNYFAYATNSPFCMPD